MTRLSDAIAKARGDILTEDEMKANIDFLNEMARRIKEFSVEPHGGEVLEQKTPLQRNAPPAEGS